jgi:hypothetical protein
MVQPVPLYDAIGRVISEGAHLEVAFAELVTDLDPAGRSLRWESPARLADECEHRLASSRLPPETITLCREAKRAALALFADRNHVIHARFFDGEISTGWTAAKPHRGGGDVDAPEWTPENLRTLATALTRLRIRMHGLRWEITSGRNGFEVDLRVEPTTVYLPTTRQFTERGTR